MSGRMIVALTLGACIACNKAERSRTTEMSMRDTAAPAAAAPTMTPPLDTARPALPPADNTSAPKADAGPSVPENEPPTAPVKKSPPAPTSEEIAQTKQGMQALQLSAYPARGQSDNQIVLDERACYRAAKEQTGIDPEPILAQAPANADSAAQAARQAGEGKASGAGVKGAAGGALVGAGVGAIAGNAGAGAAIGAATGAVAGHRKKKQTGEQAAQQAQGQAEAQAQGQAQTIDAFKKSMSACLTSKGYTVS